MKTSLSEEAKLLQISKFPIRLIRKPDQYLGIVPENLTLRNVMNNINRYNIILMDEFSIKLNEKEIDVIAWMNFFKSGINCVGNKTTDDYCHALRRMVHDINVQNRTTGDDRTIIIFYANRLNSIIEHELPKAFENDMFDADEVPVWLADVSPGGILFHPMCTAVKNLVTSIPKLKKEDMEEPDIFYTVKVLWETGSQLVTDADLLSSYVMWLDKITTLQNI